MHVFFTYVYLCYVPLMPCYVWIECNKVYIRASDISTHISCAFCIICNYISRLSEDIQELENLTGKYIN